MVFVIRTKIVRLVQIYTEVHPIVGLLIVDKLQLCSLSGSLGSILQISSFKIKLCSFLSKI